MTTRLKIKLNNKAAITITRSAIQTDKLVYIARSNKPFRYKYGKSRIVYIGTTQAGVHRIATSAAHKAEDLLGRFGVKQLEFHVVTSKKRPNVQSWRLLERALLLTFRERYGEIPHCNSQGLKIQWNDERDCFRDDHLRHVINQLS